MWFNNDFFLIWKKMRIISSANELIDLRFLFLCKHNKFKNDCKVSIQIFFRKYNIEFWVHMHKEKLIKLNINAEILITTVGAYSWSKYNPWSNYKPWSTTTNLVIVCWISDILNFVKSRLHPNFNYILIN